MTEFIYLNVVLHLNHEECAGNEPHTTPMKHFSKFERKEAGFCRNGREVMKGEIKKIKLEGGAEGGDTNKALTDRN